FSVTYSGVSRVVSSRFLPRLVGCTKSRVWVTATWLLWPICFSLSLMVTSPCLPWSMTPAATSDRARPSCWLNTPALSEFMNSLVSVGFIAVSPLLGLGRLVGGGGALVIRVLRVEPVGQVLQVHHGG